MFSAEIPGGAFYGRFFNKIYSPVSIRIRSGYGTTGQF
ncbi:hypothetical protein BSM4216_2209 [Bacillus smithii]|nr:hypothetical protein BSM4216_2209 [Bacillus smithii]